MSVNVCSHAVISKGIGIEPYLDIPPCNVCAQFVAKKVGIAASKHKMDFLAQQPIDQQRPLLYVLHFVKKQMGICAVDIVKCLLQPKHIAGME